MSSDAKTLIRGVSQGWAIKWLNGERQGEVLLIEKELTTVGRSEESDVQIEQGFVSREHAAFLLREDKLFLVDNGSSNGTLVNGEKTDEVELSEADVVEFDEIQFEVLYLGQKKQPVLSEMKTMIRPSISVDKAVGGNVSQPLKNKTVEVEGKSTEVVEKVSNDSVKPQSTAMQETQLFSEALSELESSPKTNKEVETLTDSPQIDPNRTAVFTGALNAQDNPAEALSLETIVQPAVSASDNDTPVEGTPLVLDALKDEAFSQVPEGAVCIRGLTDPVLGQDFELSKSRMRVGRSPFNEIVIKDSPVSTQHAEIKKISTGKWAVVDKNSSNGTYINNKEVKGEQELKTGDIIAFGSVRLEFDPLAVLGEPPKKSLTNLIIIIAAMLATGLLVFGALTLLQPKIESSQSDKQTSEETAEKKTKNFGLTLSPRWQKNFHLDVPRNRLAYGDFLGDSNDEVIIVTEKNAVSFLDLKTAEPVFYYQLDSNIAKQPLVFNQELDNKVLLIDFSGKLTALDARRGVIWQRQLEPTVARAQPEAKIAPSAKLILLASLAEGVIAVNSQTGEKLWSSHLNAHNDPVVDFLFIEKGDQQQLLTLSSTGKLEMFLVDNNGTSHLWQKKTDLKPILSSMTLLSDNAVVIVDSLGQVQLLNLVNSQVLWQQSLQRKIQAPGVLVDGNFYLADMHGMLNVFDVGSGELVLEKSLGSAVASPLIEVGDKIGLVGLNGAVQLFARNGEQLVSQASLNAEPVAQQMLYIQGDESILLTLSINGSLQALTLN